MKRTVLAVIPLSVGLVWLWPGLFAAPSSSPTPDQIQRRAAALAGARVIRESVFNAADIDFARPDAEAVPQSLECRFVPSEPSGTTPKFDCRLPSGQKIKVKYGWTREIPAEVAAARLLNGLGFAADRMWRVASVRCFGCVVAPFHVREAAAKLHLLDAFDRHLSYDHAIDFVNVAVETKLHGDAVEAGPQRGWAFYELSGIDPARGGATRAEVDALRLMAIFLHHWDNKSQNQRLLCEGDQDAPCEHPMAMMQDLGSDFGPRKMNLEKWRERPIWADAASCKVSMKGLPYDGATFQDTQITEGGRLFLARRLKQLSAPQIQSLFTSAGFTHVDEWVAAFQDKVRQIADRKPCPTL